MTVAWGWMEGRKEGRPDGFAPAGGLPRPTPASEEASSETNSRDKTVLLCANPRGVSRSPFKHISWWFCPTLHNEMFLSLGLQGQDPALRFAWPRVAFALRSEFEL